MTDKHTFKVSNEVLFGACLRILSIFLSYFYFIFKMFSVRKPHLKTTMVVLLGLLSLGSRHNSIFKLLRVLAIALLRLIHENRHLGSVLFGSKYIFQHFFCHNNIFNICILINREMNENFKHYKCQEGIKENKWEISS